MDKDKELGFVVCFAVRYALGRKTFAPNIVTEYIMNHIDDIDDQSITAMKYSMERDRELGLGSPEIGKPIWDKFYTFLQEELKKRG